MLAAGARKSMALAFVDIDHNLIVSGQPGLHFVLLLLGHVFVLGSHMQDQRRVDRLIEVFRQHNPIIPDRSISLGPRRRQIGEPAT